MEFRAWKLAAQVFHSLRRTVCLAQPPREVLDPRKPFVAARDDMGVAGEELAGWSMTFSPDDDAFRLFPADTTSNIEMLYVFRHALRRILTEEDAVIAAREYHVRKNNASSGSLAGDDWERYLLR